MTHVLNKIFFLSLLFTSLMLLASAQAEEKTTDKSENQFQEIDDLISLGVPNLALRLLKKRQPSLIENNQDHWLLWEKKRIQLMFKLQHWALLVERINANSNLWGEQGSSSKEINIDISKDDINWFKIQQIKAHLQLGNNSEALSLLQRVLWYVDEYTDSSVIAMLRRLVVRSYLQLNKIEDAQRAMRRYQQDYGSLENEDGLQWTILQMQLLIRTNRYNEVIQSLSNASTDEEKAILLVAQIGANTQPPQQIKKQLEALLPVNSISQKEKLQHKKAQKNNTHNRQKQLHDFVSLRLAIAELDLQSKAQLIESFLAAKKLNQLKEVFYDVDKYISAEKLWDAYEVLGYQLANQYKLLRGDDEAWYLKASNLFETKPLQARAMYSILAFNAQQEQHRALAFEQLVKLLDAQESGIRIINTLFMKSSRINNIENLPVKVRYRLVDYALSRADLKSAAKIMQNLQQPPEGEDAFAWNLRRVRILVMGSEYQQGAAILDQVLANRKQMSDVEIDQFMQVLFDFQAIEQHQLALQAFEKLEQYSLSKKLQREIAFWKAESYQALDEYEQAAYLFLQSAQPLDEQYDPWFHTASFKAAESLAQAELIDDARRQYIKLLRITANAARKSVIKQRLQQLRLLKSKTVTVTGNQTKAEAQ